MHVVNRQLIKGDYRGKRLIIGANGVIREDVLSTYSEIGEIEFIMKNGVYYLIISNLDCRRRKLEIQGTPNFSHLHKICFLP